MPVTTYCCARVSSLRTSAHARTTGRESLDNFTVHNSARNCAIERERESERERERQREGVSQPQCDLAVCRFLSVNTASAIDVARIVSRVEMLPPRLTIGKYTQVRPLSREN